MKTKRVKESTSGNQESHSKPRLAQENPLVENSTAQKSESTSGPSETKTEPKTAEEKAEIKNAYTQKSNSIGKKCQRSLTSFQNRILCSN